MRLAALFALALFPFMGMALLAWIGPGRSWAARYRHARDHTAAMAQAEEDERRRLETADARLRESQRRLRSDEDV